MQKILLVDDDADCVDAVAEMLSGSFELLPATTAREGIAVAVQERPAVIVLDVNLPEVNGYEVCRKLREQPSTRGIPIIMLSSWNDVEHRIRGLDCGADDYLAKPFHGRELIARIKARLRQQNLQSKLGSITELGNLKIAPESLQVWLDGEEVHLTQLEFELLQYFIDHQDKVIGRGKLLGDLWPDTVVTNRTVDTHIANLRRKIRGFSYPLQTIYGAGYILKTTTSH
jgi:DNA-binding response OmpR family regulator